MTTLIYLFLMSVILFVVPQLVVKALNKSPKIDKNIYLLVFASILPIVWTFLPRELADVRSINFLKHMIGGGVAIGLVSFYFINSLKINFPIFKNYIFQILFTYALVCMFGVSNEILEFFFDVVKIGVFSADRYDTWFDLTANTLGAAFIFLILKVFFYLHSKIDN